MIWFMLGTIAYLAIAGMVLAAYTYFLNPYEDGNPSATFIAFSIFWPVTLPYSLSATATMWVLQRFKANK